MEWAIEKNIRVELRMHSNRKVTYNNEQIKISEIEDLMPKGRHKSRTIKVIWHGMTLYITAEKRIDKHNEESIVYLASTYKDKPSKHVTNYKKRWATEKLFRTCKQSIGLNDCISTKFEIQERHVSSVLLSYAIVQLEMKKRKFDTPEKTIKWVKAQKQTKLKQWILALGQIFGANYA